MIVSLSYYRQQSERLSSVWTCWLGTSLWPNLPSASHSPAGNPQSEQLNVSVMAAAWSTDTQELWSIWVLLYWVQDNSEQIIKKALPLSSRFSFSGSVSLRPAQTFKQETGAAVVDCTMLEIHKYETFKLIKFTSVRICLHLSFILNP